MPKPTTPFSILAYLVVAAALTGCASHPATPVTVTITSHTDGQRIVGGRGVTLTGTLSGAAPTAFSVTLDGSPVAGTSHTDTAFSAPLVLGDGGNVVEVLATSAAGTTSASVTLVYPFLNLPNFAPATTVLGQAAMTTDATGSGPASMSKSYGDPALVNGVLYVPDYSNHRVLGYLGGIPAANGAAADFALGQADLTSTAPSAADTGLLDPQTVRAAGAGLLTVDYGNNRVLLWNAAPTANAAPADLVVGQDAFGASTGGCTAAKLHNPEGAFATADLLIVTDSVNNRVLIYHGLPTSSGATPDVVLGQADLTHCAPNDDNQDGAQDAGPTARTLYYPTDAWTDGTRLVVADDDNSRVLIWNTLPTSDFEPADVVLGQSSMTTNASGGGAAGMGHPYFLASNGNQLFVADYDNSRVLRFDAIPATSGTSADHVLGQSNFTHASANDDNQDDSVDANPSARTLDGPTGLLVTDDALLAMDHGNARVLVYRP